MKRLQKETLLGYLPIVPFAVVEKIDLAAWMKANKKSRAAIAAASGVSASTVSTAARGNPIQEGKAAAIAQAMGKKLTDVFTVKQDSDPLSDRTVLAYHRLISIVLVQAEKEMLVPYNAAAKATPPKATKKAPNYFQPETISEILRALINRRTVSREASCKFVACCDKKCTPRCTFAFTE